MTIRYKDLNDVHVWGAVFAFLKGSILGAFSIFPVDNHPGPGACPGETEGGSENLMMRVSSRWSF